MRGLVVGRFQPLHKGHDAVIRQAIEDCVHVAIAVGSTNAKTGPKNPMTWEERRAVIAAAYPDAEVFNVPDIHDPPNWVGHLLDITGPVDKVFGNDEQTLSLFEDAGIKVVRTGLQARDRYEGQTIRMQMAEGDGAWRKSIPPGAVEALEALELPMRLRRLEAML